MKKAVSVFLLVAALVATPFGASALSYVQPTTPYYSTYQYPYYQQQMYWCGSYYSYSPCQQNYYYTYPDHYSYPDCYQYPYYNYGYSYNSYYPCGSSGSSVDYNYGYYYDYGYSYDYSYAGYGGYNNNRRCYYDPLYCYPSMYNGGYMSYGY